MLRYSISDLQLFPGTPRRQVGALLDQVHHLAHLGVDFFQLREPDLPTRTLADIARDILALLHRSGSPTRLLLNTRADIAAATGAHGVHLPSTPGHLTPTHIRNLFRRCHLPPPTVSRSAHTLLDLHAPDIHADPPDLLLFGPVFEKRVHGDLLFPGTGLDLLHQATLAAHPTPVLALGGITPANTPSCLHAGAAGIAGIRLFLAPPPSCQPPV